MADFWIIGPIAWDLALYVDHIPPSGHFVQASESVERPGGTGANVAVALSQAGGAESTWWVTSETTPPAAT
ncbi:hypothetical protein [Nonomuraea salmonea]|uniref:hypothetical protein n=1 Tax=Nonomuraea salmonea TaxID=46181 RepID=UPI002FEC2040